MERARAEGREVCFQMVTDDIYAISKGCLLYTSDAADDLLCVDLGGRRIIKKKKNIIQVHVRSVTHNNKLLYTSYLKWII